MGQKLQKSLIFFTFVSQCYIERLSRSLVAPWANLQGNMSLKSQDNLSRRSPLTLAEAIATGNFVLEDRSPEGIPPEWFLVAENLSRL